MYVAKHRKTGLYLACESVYLKDIYYQSVWTSDVNKAYKFKDVGSLTRSAGQWLNFGRIINFGGMVNKFGKWILDKDKWEVLEVN